VSNRASRLGEREAGTESAKEQERIAGSYAEANGLDVLDTFLGADIKTQRDIVRKIVARGKRWTPVDGRVEIEAR